MARMSKAWRIGAIAVAAALAHGAAMAQDGGRPGRGDRDRDGDAGRALAEQRGAYLGVTMRDADGKRGAVLESVREGSPAAKAGLRAGDRVFEMQGVAINGPDDLRRTVGSYDAGTKVTLSVERDGWRRKIAVTLGARPAESREAGEAAREDEGAEGREQRDPHGLAESAREEAQRRMRQLEDRLREILPEGDEGRRFDADDLRRAIREHEGELARRAIEELRRQGVDEETLRRVEGALDALRDRLGGEDEGRDGARRRELEALRGHLEAMRRQQRDLDRQVDEVRRRIEEIERQGEGNRDRDDRDDRGGERR